MTPRIAMLVVALLALTLGLAQDGADEAREVDIAGGEPPAEKACFNVREARNFSALDDRHVYLEAPRNKHFLLTMVPGCFGLEGSLQIAISNNLSRVCSVDFAKITYRGLSGGLETCPIRQVEAVEDRAAAEQLAEFRNRANDE